MLICCVCRTHLIIFVWAISALDTNLEDLNIGNTVRAMAAAVSFNVLEPLNVRLSITVNLAVELNITAYHRCGVSG